MENNNQHRTLAELRDEVGRFIVARDWDQFHTPKDLAIGLITEASEVLELFRFRDETEIEVLLQNPKFREALTHELADTLFFLLAFSRKLNIDLVQAFEEKLSISAAKYPVAQAKGSNAKYTELRRDD